jgi:hypothetical protein
MFDSPAQCPLPHDTDCLPRDRHAHVRRPSSKNEDRDGLCELLGGRRLPCRPLEPLRSGSKTLRCHKPGPHLRLSTTCGLQMVRELVGQGCLKVGRGSRNTYRDLGSGWVVDTSVPEVPRARDGHRTEARCTRAKHCGETLPCCANHAAQVFRHPRIKNQRRLPIPGGGIRRAPSNHGAKRQDQAYNVHSSHRAAHDIRTYRSDGSL